MNYEMLSDRIAVISKAVNRLEKMKELTLKDFLQDDDNFAIAEHNIRMALEGIFDIGRHIVVKSGLGKPDDYRQILVILSQNKILPPDFFEKIKGMAGYRNRLVHLYKFYSACFTESFFKTYESNWRWFNETVLQDFHVALCAPDLFLRRY